LRRFRREPFLFAKTNQWQISGTVGIPSMAGKPIQQPDERAKPPSGNFWLGASLGSSLRKSVGKSNPANVVKYLASYLTGGPISDRRIIKADDDEVWFWARPKKDSSDSQQRRSLNTPQPYRLSGLQFVRRWTLHILPKEFTRSRCFALPNPGKVIFENPDRISVADTKSLQAFQKPVKLTVCWPPNRVQSATATTGQFIAKSIQRHSVTG